MRTHTFLRALLFAALAMAQLMAQLHAQDLELAPDVVGWWPAAATFRFSDVEPRFELKKTAPPTMPGFAVSDGLAAPTSGDGRRDAHGGTDHGWWLITTSDTRFTNWISPITNPLYFENPRTVTESRFLFLHQRVPLSAQGGDIDLLLWQLRAALGERLSVLAAKAGFITSSSPLIEDGWADVNLGLKYNLWADPEAQRLVSVGGTYEMPVGSTRTEQGRGGGRFELFVTGACSLSKWQAISTAGLLLPADWSEESSLGFWSQHLSRRLGGSALHVVGELHWYHWMSAGEGPASLLVEGGDLFSLGGSGVAGNDIVTSALGFRYKPSDRLELGVAWEIPITERRDLLDNRLTTDCIVRF